MVITTGMPTICNAFSIMNPIFATIFCGSMMIMATLILEKNDVIPHATMMFLWLAVLILFSHMELCWCASLIHTSTKLQVEKVGHPHHKVHVKPFSHLLS